MLLNLNSFFDKQLFSRGIEISKGREQISLNQLQILQFTEKTFTSFFLDETVDQAIRKFKKTKTTEGYLIDKNNIFIVHYLFPNKSVPILIIVAPSLIAAP